MDDTPRTSCSARNETMTESEWVNATDPRVLLSWLHEQGMLTERKVRLFTVACCRSIWHLMTDERSRKAVEVAEQYADGAVSQDQLADAFLDVGDEADLHQTPPYVREVIRFATSAVRGAASTPL